MPKPPKGSHRMPKRMRARYAPAGDDGAMGFMGGNSSEDAMVVAMMSALRSMAIREVGASSAGEFNRIMWDKKAKTMRSPSTGNDLRYCVNMCSMNAEWNRTHAYLMLDLRVVVGTLALNGWEEYGGASWSSSKWREAQKGKGVWDAHCWLEDAEGNVYDYIFPDYLSIADIRNARGPMKVGILERVSKAECVERGVTYTPAPTAIQEMILRDYREAGCM